MTPVFPPEGRGDRPYPIQYVMGYRNVQYLQILCKKKALRCADLVHFE